MYIVLSSSKKGIDHHGVLRDYQSYSQKEISLLTEMFVWFKIHILNSIMGLMVLS